MERDITIFISYAHEDEQLHKKLQKHLRLLERVKKVEVWSDRNILAGAEREREINFHYDIAQIILLLISPDFMASEHCYTEMERVMERYEAKTAYVIPIILRPVLWEDAPFAKLEVLPTDAKPVTSKAWHTQDYAFFDIVQGIRKVMEEGKIQRRESISIGYNHRHDFGEEAPGITNFYGRESELAELKHWIVSDRCQLVAVVGTGGIGKTSLALRMAEQIKDQFEYVFWRKLQRKPSLKSILQKCIQLVSNQQKVELSEDIEDQIDSLIPYLREHRCLLILDNFESVMQDGHPVTRSTEYGRLLERVGQVRKSQSCLLLTSREKPTEMIRLEGKSMPARALTLLGLSTGEGREILEDKSLSDNDDSSIDDLVRFCSGNPLLLQLVVDPILNLFEGNIASFMREEQSILSNMDKVKELLDSQFRRLSALEEEIMYWLAIEREAVSLNDLRENILLPASKRALPNTLLSLQRRSLIETRGIATFTLQPVIMEYVTERFVQRVCQEFEAEKVGIIGSHAFMKAQSQDYIREGQGRFILMPITEQLHSNLGKEAFEEKCKWILTQLRATSSQHAPYAAGNILNMLIQLGYGLHSYDFSHLALWQAYLQGTSLLDVNFAYVEFEKPLFTDTFGGISSVAFNPDGSLLTAGTENGEIRIWNTVSGGLIHTFRSNSDCIFSVVFSPDGITVASGSEDHTVRLWDVSTGQCRKILQGHTDTVSSIVFSLDGKLLVTGGQDGTIKLWNVETGESLSTLSDHPGEDIFWSIALSPDGKLLASGSEDHAVRLWDVSTGQLFKTLDGHNDWVYSVAFSSDGKTLASSSDDGTIRLWDIGNGQCLKTIPGHAGMVWSVAFHPNQHILASGSADQTVRLWDVSGGWCLKTLQGYTNGILSVAFSPDGKFLASGSEDKIIRLWDMKTGQCRKTLPSHLDRVWSVAFSPNGRKLVSASTEALRVWDTHEDQYQVLLGHTSWVYCATFSPDGKLLASGSDDGTIRLWDVSGGNGRVLFEGREMVNSVAFSSDSKRIVSGCGKVYLWDLSASGQPLITTMDCIFPIWSVAFSPDGLIIAGGGEDHVVYLWDANTGQRFKTLSGHTNAITLVAFSPDGKTVASGSNDYTIRLWDVDKGLCTKILQGHTDRVSTVAFSPNGRTIASGSQDGTIKRWSAKTGRCLDTLRSNRPYERMNITGVRGITEAQKTMLEKLGAVEGEGELH